jgi:5-hydroxyisourate hydrolase
MISSHVLDTALGCPARNMTVHLDVGEDADRWRRIATAVTNHDGRVSELADAAGLDGRTCRLSFETGDYFAAASRPTFFPRVDVLFVPSAVTARYHIPLLLSPFSYSAYRGS